MTSYEDIKKTLWACADIFRDMIDAYNCKDYILAMLFVKYLSKSTICLMFWMKSLHLSICSTTKILPI